MWNPTEVAWNILDVLEIHNLPLSIKLQRVAAARWAETLVGLEEVVSAAIAEASGGVGLAVGWHNSTGYSFWTGRRKRLARPPGAEHLIIAPRTWPSRLLITSSTTASFQRLRFTLSSCTTTTSPTHTSGPLLDCWDRCALRNSRRYSLRHLDQKWSSKLLRWSRRRNRLSRWMEATSTSSGDTDGHERILRPSNRCDGVNGSSTSSVDTNERGRLLRMASTSTNAVRSSS